LFRARFHAREARDPVVFGVPPASHSSRPRSTLRVGGLGTPSGVTHQSPLVVKWTLSEVTAERERLSHGRQQGPGPTSFWQTLCGAR